MLIPNASIPQANTIDEVVAAVVAVGNGARTYQDIATAAEKGKRHGRYYRLAAVNLGLMTNRRNQAALTKDGVQLVNATEEHRKQLLRSILLCDRLFQRVIAFIEIHPEKVTPLQIAGFLEETTEATSTTTMKRRASTVVSWMSAVDLLVKVNGGYTLSPSAYKETKFLEFDSDDEPLLPRTGRFREYETVSERTASAREEITIFRSQAKTDRANAAHRRLVNLVADRIKSRGVTPHCNKYIDLAARVNEHEYIFEMKSITSDNARSQVRGGISQLYEYQFFQEQPDATLVLVLETCLPIELKWMHSYLKGSRQVRLIWADGDQLHGDLETDADLAFLR